MNEITCPGCGVVFTPHDSRQKFCSKVCRTNYHHRASYRRHAEKHIEKNREYRAKKKSEILETHA